MFKRMAIALVAGAMLLTGCVDEAEVAEHNLTKSADNFGVLRRIVFVNGITDEYLLEIQGVCSIEHEGSQIETLCKTPGGYKKHIMGLSDNVTYVVEQLSDEDVSGDHYKIVFRPQTIVPDVDLGNGQIADPPTKDEVTRPEKEAPSSEAS